MRVPSGKTDQLIYFVAVDSTDLKTRETGLSSFTVYRSRNGGAATAYTTPTVAELSAANMPGVYSLTLDEDTTIASSSDSEEYCVHITQASMAPVTRTIELYRRDTTSGQTATITSGGVTLADAVSHGGTLGSSTATLALSRASIVSQSSNTAALTVTGNGTGSGELITGGATGNGVTISAGATSGHGIIATATGTSFNGARFVGSPTTGEGLYVLGGSTSGAGFRITTTSGHAIHAVATGTTMHGIVATGGATTSDGIIATGGGVGMGIRAVGGGGAAAHGIQVTGGSASGNGINITTTSGHAISAVATGTTAHGIHAAGGATTSQGINAIGGGVGHGILATSGSGATGNGIAATAASTNGNGLAATGTGTGNGILTTGGAGAGGDGLEAVAGGGVPIRGDITGNITGTLATVTTLTNLPAITANWLTAAGTDPDFGTEVGIAVWASVARTLTALDEDSTTLDLDATIRAAVGLASANLDTQLGDIGGNVFNLVQASIVLEGTAESGTTTTLVDTTGLTSATNDHYNGNFVLFLSGTIAGECRLITDYVAATSTITFTPATTAAVSTEEYIMIPFTSAVGGGSAPTAAEIADAVLDEDMTAHQTQGSLGQAIGDPGADTNTIFKAVVTDATGVTVGTDTATLLTRMGTPSDLGGGATVAGNLSDIEGQTDNLPTIEGKIDTIDGIVDLILVDTTQIKADLPGRITKNTALGSFEFLMVSTTDHVTGATGLTVSASRSIDGGAFAACANAASEVGSGVYKIDLAASDLNGNVITLLFTAAGADNRVVTIVTQVT